MIASTSCRYLFDSLGASADGLLALLDNARVTKTFYRFTGLTAQEVSVSGLLLEGDLSEIIPILDQIPGAVRYDE